jgi:hypothetical protein
MHEDILGVVFGIDHIIAEFFWNAIFAIAVFAFSKAKAKRSLHKYIDDKHGVTHQEDEY